MREYKICPKKPCPNPHQPYVSFTSTDGWGSSIEPNVQYDLVSQTVLTGLSDSDIVTESFLGAVIVGDSVFFAPQDHNEIVKISLTDGVVTTVDVSGYGRVTNPTNKGDKFNGCLYDGKFVWLIPSWTDRMVRLDPNDLTTTDIIVNTYGDDAYNGGVFDGKRIWAVSHDALDYVSVDINTLSVTKYPLNDPSKYSSGDKSFVSGAFDGHSLWFFPRWSKYLIQIDPETGAIIGEFEHPQSAGNRGVAGYFQGGSFDGRYIYLVPYASPNLEIFDTATKSWTSLPHGASGSDQYFIGSIFDGRFIYMLPLKSDDVLKFDTFDRTFTLIPQDQPQVTYGTAVAYKGELIVTDITKASQFYRIKTYQQGIH